MALQIVIVGGVAGGMSAATRARRMNEKASIIVLEKGGFISFANCGMPYYLGGQIDSQAKLLVTTPQAVRDRFRIDVRTHSQALSIDRAARKVNVRDLASGSTYDLAYDKLILAPGASAIVPPIEHVDAPNVRLLRSMEDTIAVKKWLDTHTVKHVAVIGAGFIGLEVAEAMRDRGLGVTVIEKAPHVLPPLDAEMAAAIVDELAKHGVKLITGVGLSSLRAFEDGTVNGVGLEDGRVIDADLVLMSIGVRPLVNLAADAGITLGSSGAIAVNEHRQTNDPLIYAVGDASEVSHGVTGASTRIPLAGPANRQGRLAGEHAATGSAADVGRVLGTAIVKVFGLTVASTGLNERDATRMKLRFDTAYVMSNHHAGYYPGAKQMRIKMVYETPTGRVLGAQIIGIEGVDKRIDVIATAMAFGSTIHQLATLDLAYAPPYGSAKDPVHMVAFVAQNQLRGDAKGISPMQYDGRQLLDVRTAEEFAAGSLPGAKHIPLDELRSRLGELDPRTPLVVFCQVGLRGYLAQRILLQHGFTDVLNLKGGYTLAKLVEASKTA